MSIGGLLISFVASTLAIMLSAWLPQVFDLPRVVVAVGLVSGYLAGLSLGGLLGILSGAYLAHKLNNRFGWYPQTAYKLVCLFPFTPSPNQLPW